MVKVSPRGAYRSGARFEGKVHDHLYRQGYAVVVESRGSHGLADLVAIKPGQILLVQCKTTFVATHGEWNALFELAEQVGALAIIADRPMPGAIRYRRIVGRHVERKKFWPLQSFVVDQLAHPRKDTSP